MSNAQSPERIRYPENSLLGILDTTQQLTSAITALKAAGFPESDIEFVCGREAGEKLHATTGRGGIMNVAMRVVSSLGMPDEETQMKDRYSDALMAGRFIVMVKIPTDDRKAEATRILKTNGANFINFLGKYVIESMAPMRDGLGAEGR
jgi:hypothetical protein